MTSGLGFFHFIQQLWYGYDEPFPLVVSFHRNSRKAPTSFAAYLFSMYSLYQSGSAIVCRGKSSIANCLDNSVLPDTSWSDKEKLPIGRLGDLGRHGASNGFRNLSTASS